MKTLTILLGLVLSALGSIRAAEITLKSVDRQPPTAVSDAIKAVLQTRAIQLIEGDQAAFEFWFGREIPLKGKIEGVGNGLQALSEMTLLGVATIGEGKRDYKDSEIPAGTYTMRFGLQPQDGDHLGTADFPYFVVLIPAKSDQELQSFKTYKAMLKASGKATATGHPIVISLRPVNDSKDVPALTRPVADHKAVKLNLRAKAADSESAADLAFELVYEGRYKG
ncbi:MAG: hypothetical protein U1G07_24460 [Verrucomicrobiota bacterium]